MPPGFLLVVLVSLLLGLLLPVADQRLLLVLLRLYRGVELGGGFVEILLPQLQLLDLLVLHVLLELMVLALQALGYFLDVLQVLLLLLRLILLPLHVLLHLLLEVLPLQLLHYGVILLLALVR